MNTELDILIPVYDEGENILRVLDALRHAATTPFRVLLCYDYEGDTSVAAVRASPPATEVIFVKNRSRGALEAVLTGFAHSTAPAVLVFPGDDDYNAKVIDSMMAKFREGCDIVVASRFIPGGCMVGAPFLKAAIIRVSAWVLHHLAGVPTADPSNGFRLFSQRLLQRVRIETKVGFAYSIELLVKGHRMGLRIGEVPVEWYERTTGQSRFRVLGWLPQYFVWFRYAFATRILGRREVA